MSITRKILLIIISSPLFILGILWGLMTACLLPVVLPFLFLVTIILVIKKDEDAYSDFWGFLCMWCGLGFYIYFDMVWDYELFDF
jgi:hypothetical protein